MKEKASLKDFIQNNPFDRNAKLNATEKLDKVISDWIRLAALDRIAFKNEPLSKVLTKAGINISDVIGEEGDINITDELRLKFKFILGKLIPDNVEPVRVLENLTAILHQGGVMFRLFNHIEHSLNEKDMRCDSLNNMQRQANFIPTEEGFIVNTILAFRGNIIKKSDVEDIVYDFAKGGDLILAQCDQTITVNASGQIDIQVTRASIDSPIPALVAQLSSQTKEELQAETVGTDSISLSDIEMNEDYFSDNSSSSDDDSVVRKLT